MWVKMLYDRGTTKSWNGTGRVATQGGVEGGTAWDSPMGVPVPFTRFMGLGVEGGGGGWAERGAHRVGGRRGDRDQWGTGGGGLQELRPMRGPWDSGGGRFEKWWSWGAAALSRATGVCTSESGGDSTRLAIGLVPATRARERGQGIGRSREEARRNGGGRGGGGPRASRLTGIRRDVVLLKAPL